MRAGIQPEAMQLWFVLGWVTCQPLHTNITMFTNKLIVLNTKQMQSFCCTVNNIEHVVTDRQALEVQLVCKFSNPSGMAATQ